MNQTYHTYWADLHNHNSAGTAFGSMERSLDIARSQLDVFAFTGQSQWHDMKKYESGAHHHWLNGFREHERQWPRNLELLREAYRPGSFVTFPGYEWHSSFHGDYNILFPDDRAAAFRLHPTMDDLAQWAEQRGAMLIPHHLGYSPGLRGANWDTFRNERSPLVEIMSEHGCCERDEGPFPYIRHGIGSRTSGQTLQGALDRGFHIGVTGGTDNHVGFPGAYGEGLTAIMAGSLDRESIWEALWQRRTYAVSGDRIRLDVRLNGQPMGSRIAAATDREIGVDVRGWDRLALVELLKNNEVVYRHFVKEEPMDFSRPFVLRIAFGWGPWGDLKMARMCDWDVRAAWEQAVIEDVCPCFCSLPFDETRRSVLLERDGQQCRWISYTRRQGSFEERPNAVAFLLRGGERGNVHLELARTAGIRRTFALSGLAKSNASFFTGDFQSEHVLLHRLVPESAFRTSFRWIDDVPDSGREEDFYYVRVTQDNGQMAWSSPVWARKEA